jgi:TATA-binding protein-associated factor
VAYAKEDVGELIPRFESLKEWEPLKSTKMDVCARICAHYLKHDHVDDVRFEEGQLILPDVLQRGYLGLVGMKVGFSK